MSRTRAARVELEKGSLFCGASGFSKVMEGHHPGTVKVFKSFRDPIECKPAVWGDLNSRSRLLLILFRDVECHALSPIDDQSFLPSQGSLPAQLLSGDHL